MPIEIYGDQGHSFTLGYATTKNPARLKCPSYAPAVGIVLTKPGKTKPLYRSPLVWKPASSDHQHMYQVRDDNPFDKHGKWAGICSLVTPRPVPKGNYDLYVDFGDGTYSRPWEIAPGDTQIAIWRFGL